MRVEQAEKALTRFTGITPKRSTKPWWNGRAACRALLLFSSVLWLFVGSAKADLVIPGTNSAAATFFTDSNGATGTAVNAASAGGFATAFPGRNKSYLAVIGDAASGGQAAANVHFDVVNKTTGRVDPFAVVLLQIYGTASISNPADINNHAVWSVTAADDQPPPLLDFSTSGAGIVFANMVGGGFSVSNASTYGYGFAVGAARGGQTGNFVGSEYQDGLVPLGTKSPVTKSANPNLGIGLVLFTDGHVDVDEEVNLAGLGAVALDPVLTALNPDDIIVSDALFNPNPDAPLLTAAQIAQFTAAGVDLSGFREGGLIGGAPVPEPGYLPMLGVGIAMACWRKRWAS
jgi:hypothetical protein